MVRELWPIAVAVAVAVAVPGPNVLVVMSTAVRDRRAGLLTGLGVSTGDMGWAVAAMVGLGAVLASGRPLFVVLKWAGAVYLLVLAVQLYRDEGAAAPAEAAAAPSRPFLRGVLVDLANPKAAVFFTSLYASLLPQDMSFRLGLATLAVTGAVDYLWYLVLATLISRPGPQRAYRRASRVLNRVTAGVIAGLGVRLALAD